MTPERWKQIDSLLQDVLEAHPDERNGLLDHACTDQALRQEVESLLHFREMAQNFLEKPALEEAAWLLVEDQDDLIAELLVNRYRIEKCLGAGSMGEVYLAEDTWLDRKVAIKFLPSYLQADEVSRKRLIREAKSAAKLDHPNICAVYEVNKTDDRSFIVMQYIAGETLGDVLKNRRPSVGSVLDIVIQILEALAEAHSYKTVHRDIKPANIMLTLQGQVKVLDFGLAKQVGISLPEEGDYKWMGVLSQPGEHAGTPPYMSPEQVTGGAVDARSDLFAVGVILYECLTGRRPFSGDNITTIFEQEAHVDPVPVSSLSPEVPAELDMVITRALAKDPDARYQSAKELLADLRELRAVISPDDIATPVLPAKPLPHSFWTTVSKLMIAGASALIVLVLWLNYRPLHQPLLAAVSHYERGTEALRNGAYFEASKALEQAVAADGKYALAHARLAEAYSELDRSDKAKDEVILAQSTSRDQRMEESDYLFLKAITSTVQRDFAKATTFYQQLATQASAPEKSAVLIDLGRAYEKNDEIDKATECYQQSAILAPDDAVAFLRLGMLHGRDQKLESALKAFKKAEGVYRGLNQPEGVAEVFYQRGFWLLNRLQLTEARTELESALQIAKETANLNQEIRALFALSSIAVHERRTADAEAQAKQAIQLAESNGMEYQATGGFAWLGNVFSIRGDLGKAEEYYQRSLELARMNNGRLNKAIALLNLARLRQQQHRMDDATAYLEQALPFLQEGKYRKWLSQAMQIQGRILRDRSDYDTALKSFDEQLRLGEEIKDSAQMMFAHEDLGNVLVRQEKYGEALDHFDQARQLLNSLQTPAWIPYVVNHQAGVLWQLGRYPEARATLDKAPVDGIHSGLKAGMLLNRVLLELSDGHFDKAQKYSRQALEIAGDDPETITIAQYALGLVQVRSGKAQAGKRHCDVAVKTATSFGDVELIFASTLALSEAMLESGDASQALATVLGLTDRLVSLGKQDSEWRAWLIAARASERLGNIAATRDYASRAAERLSSIEQKWGAEAYAGYQARPDIQRYHQQLNQLLKL